MFYCHWLFLTKTQRSIFKHFYFNFHPHKLCDFLPTRTEIAVSHSFPIPGNVSCSFSFFCLVLKDILPCPLALKEFVKTHGNQLFLSCPREKGSRKHLCSWALDAKVAVHVLGTLGAETATCPTCTWLPSSYVVNVLPEDHFMVRPSVTSFNGHMNLTPIRTQ